MTTPANQACLDAARYGREVAVGLKAATIRSTDELDGFEAALRSQGLWTPDAVQAVTRRRMELGRASA